MRAGVRSTRARVHRGAAQRTRRSGDRSSAMPARRHWPQGSHCMLVQSQLHAASGRGNTSPTTNAATASVPLRVQHRGVTQRALAHGARANAKRLPQDPPPRGGCNAGANSAARPLTAPAARAPGHTAPWQPRPGRLRAPPRTCAARPRRRRGLCARSRPRSRCS